MGAEEEQDDDVVVLVAEDGTEVAFQVLAIVEVEGHDYALLAELDAEGELPDEIDVHVFKYTETEAGPEFDDDVDEATFEKVKAAANELFEEGDE